VDGAKFTAVHAQSPFGLEIKCHASGLMNGQPKIVEFVDRGKMGTGITITKWFVGRGSVPLVLKLKHHGETVIHEIY